MGAKFTTICTIGLKILLTNVKLLIVLSGLLILMLVEIEMKQIKMEESEHFEMEHKEWDWKWYGSNNLGMFLDSIA